MIDNSTEQQFPQEVTRAFNIIQRLLDDMVISVYMFGSAVVGGLRPNSDLDLLVVVKEQLTEATRTSLVTQLMKISGSRAEDGPARPLELTVLYLADVVPWRYPPSNELVYGEWLRAEFEQNNIPQREPNPDLAIVLTKVRDNSIALFGPPAQELFDPVPMEDLRRAMAESLPALMDDLRGDERNVLLTLARMWRTLSTGDIVPKDVAAVWVLSRLPQEYQAPLDLARRAYLGECHDAWEGREEEVDALVKYLKQSMAIHMPTAT
ncbi:MAG: aminoglycoside adenylyltransferase family protein [Chloroflexota bacterium]